MDNLLPCPLCGESDGYALSEGSTYRWWNMHCKKCGRQVDECASDRRTSLDTPLPDRCDSADEAWNDAGAYAESLRQQLASQPSGSPYAYEVDNGECTELVYPAAIFKYKMFEEERITLELYKSPPSVDVLVEALQGMVDSYQYEASSENPALLKAKAALSSYKPTEG